jgi:hypothetical protein
LLITNQYAKEAGFKGRPASIQSLWVGWGSKKRSRVQYRVLLQKMDWSIAEIWSYKVDKITGDAVTMDLFKARKTSPTVARDL